MYVKFITKNPLLLYYLKTIFQKQDNVTIDKIYIPCNTDYILNKTPIFGMRHIYNDIKIPILSSCIFTKQSIYKMVNRGLEKLDKINEEGTLVISLHLFDNYKQKEVLKEIAIQAFHGCTGMISNL